MKKEEILKKILEPDGAFIINMEILDGNEETIKNFREIIEEQDQGKMKEQYEKLREAEIKRNDVMIGNMRITTSGITELIIALRNVLTDKK